MEFQLPSDAGQQGTAGYLGQRSADQSRNRLCLQQADREDPGIPGQEENSWSVGAVHLTLARTYVLC